jgi:TetR/AcrR family transcriptional regulator, repressor for uid operon
MATATARRAARTGEIVSAALGVFSQKGYAATSMEQIGAAAGIGKSTLYEYFKTKEELFTATLLAAADRWAADLEAVGHQTQDPVERLRLIGEIYVGKKESELHAESQFFFDVLSQTIMKDGVFNGQRHLIKELHQRMVRIIVDFLLTGISRGQLRPGIARDAERIAVNFLAFLDGIMMHGLIDNGFLDLRNQVEMYMDHLVLFLGAPEDPLIRQAG